MVKSAIVFMISLLIGWLVNSGTPALAADTNNGAQIFSVHCAGCHPQGGNIIRRGKTLKQKALQKYNLNSPEAIISLVSHGKNNMSAFSDRLNQAEIEDVAAYVLEQAEKNWVSSH